MDAEALYRQGDLQGAIAAMNEQVKKKPADTDARGFLSELLCITGNLDRADAQLEIVSKQAKDPMAGLSLVRQLIRAAKTRREFFTEGRAPEVLADPGAGMQASLRACLMSREGEMASAKAALDEAEKVRPAVRGTHSGASIDEFRDVDDLLGGHLEILTSTGKYYWVPIESVQRLEPRKPERPLDLCWLPVELDVASGPDGVVYMPTIYDHGSDEVDDSMRLGRATDWIEDDSGIVRGRGLKTFLVGDEAVTALELGLLEVEGSEAEAS